MPQNIMTGKEITVEEIQEKVNRYFDYMISKIPEGQEVYVSNVIAKKDLDSLFLNSNYYGVRVLLAKDGSASQEQAGIGMFIVPVVADWEENQYINQLSETDKVIYELCPSKYCTLVAHKLPLL